MRKPKLSGQHLYREYLRKSASFLQWRSNRRRRPSEAAAAGSVSLAQSLKEEETLHLSHKLTTFPFIAADQEERKTNEGNLQNK